MPNPATVAKALELIEQGAENHSYFFSKLKSPEWIEPLVEAGFFKDPPPPRKHGDYVSYPTWPESKYLKRMAPVAPTRVADVVGQLPDTDNISVHEDLARAAISLEAKSMARWATREARWISRQQHIQFPLGEALGAVIERLAKLGKTGAALELARSLLAIRCVVDSDRPGFVREPPQPYGSGLEGSNGEPADEEHREISELAASVVAQLSSRIVGQLSSYEYREFVDRHVPALLTHGGIKTFEMLCDLLEEAVESDRLGRYSESIWRPAIEPHGQNQGTDVSDSLIDAIRDASVELVDNGVTLATVIESLARRRSPIFGRMILHLASERHEQNPELAAELAACEDHFRDERLLHEYSRLLGAVFPAMDDVSKNRVMKWISEGPAFHDSFAGDVEERRKWTIYWQRRRLAWIHRDLDEEWKKRYTAIIAELGEPEHPDFTSYTTSWMGPTSPVSGEELGSLSPEEIAQYVKSWQPSGDPMAPDEEGLAGILEALVAEAPSGFLEARKAFLEVPTRYVSAVLQGLSQAVRDDVSIDWAATIDLMSWIAARQSNHSEWRSVRQDCIRLLETGLRDDLIDTRLRKAVWTIIDVAADDSDPTPEVDSQFAGDLSTQSISTVRGNALHAVVTYSLWVYRSVMETRGARPGVLGMDRVPEVRARLERHLDPEIDPSPAIRSVYGQWFPHLVLLDEAWARRHVERIFPDDQPELRDAAWETYLRFCRVYNLPFEMLRGQYLQAVDRLDEMGERDSTTRENIGGFLGEHLVTMAGRGLVAWSDDDGLLRRFFENTEPEGARRPIWVIGRYLSDEENEIPDEAVHRFQRLADELLGLLEEAGRERMGHLSRLGWWFASGRFDPEWTLERLTRLLKLAGAAKPSFAVMDSLAEMSTNHPAKTFEVLSLLVKTSTDGPGRSVLVGRSEPARVILGAALAHPPTGDDARLFIHQLGAVGHEGFRDLLEG
ncbi:MAG: hypothetical protein OXL34_10815 [Gemmatimonadota bacterium]|nr:hypothetical protein [Gemmatimonadota bacterium]